MDNSDQNIIEWEEKFNKYCEFEKKCLENLNLINNIKNNLKILLGKQREDDMIFYKSIIDNSQFYLTKSLRIRKLKFLKDINFIWGRISENRKMEEVNKTNFLALLKDYQTMAEEIFRAKKNNTTLTWVKDDKVENLQDIENDFHEIMDYHLKLMEFFCCSIELEKAFYCGK
jgi:hypothetical protein